MPLNAADANAQLASITTLEQLRDLVNQPDITAGSTTLLYSGGMPGGGDSNSAAKALALAQPGLRVIDDTQAAKFLDVFSATANTALINRCVELGFGNPKTPGTPANQFLFGTVDGHGNRVPNGAWGSVSGRFAAATSGEVRVLAYGADATRVFCATELKVLLANGAVTSIEGIPSLTSRPSKSRTAPTVCRLCSSAFALCRS